MGEKAAEGDPWAADPAEPRLLRLLQPPTAAKLQSAAVVSGGWLSLVILQMLHGFSTLKSLSNPRHLISDAVNSCHLA